MSNWNNWKVGDRVIIKPSRADGFFLPLRKYGLEQRPATVTNVFVPLGASRSTIRIVFDHRKGAKISNFEFGLGESDLVAAP